MDNSSTKKKRGRPSKGLSEYGRVSARLTEDQYNALFDYGRNHNIVDKNGLVNPSEVVRMAIERLAYSERVIYTLGPVIKNATRYTQYEVVQMMDKLGEASGIIWGLSKKVIDDNGNICDDNDEDVIYLQDLANDMLETATFLSTLLELKRYSPA